MLSIIFFVRVSHSQYVFSSIGAVHLVLSTLPAKILTLVSAFGWKADKHLGFALIKLCLDNQRIRSPTASMLWVNNVYVVMFRFWPVA